MAARAAFDQEVLQMAPTPRPVLHELITHSPALRAFNAATDPLRRSETPG
jgi:hypothetical protein